MRFYYMYRIILHTIGYVERLLFHLTPKNLVTLIFNNFIKDWIESQKGSQKE